MNDTRTVVYSRSIGWEGLSGSGNWDFGEVTCGVNHYRLVEPVRPLRWLAGLALFLAASSLTSRGSMGGTTERAIPGYSRIGLSLGERTANFGIRGKENRPRYSLSGRGS